MAEKKNVTVTLDPDVARWARVWAAEHDTSVSRMLGDLLRDRMLQEREYEAAMKSYLEASPKVLQQEGRYPSREDLHDRAGLR